MIESLLRIIDKRISTIFNAVSNYKKIGEISNDIPVKNFDRLSF